MTHMGTVDTGLQGHADFLTQADVCKSANTHVTTHSYIHDPGDTPEFLLPAPQEPWKCKPTPNPNKHNTAHIQIRFYTLEREQEVQPQIS